MAIKGLENSSILVACAAIEMPDCSFLNEHEDFPRTIITRKADAMAGFVVTSAGIGKFDAHADATLIAQRRSELPAKSFTAKFVSLSLILMFI